MDEPRDDSGILVVIPARMSSYRLPGKPLLSLGGIPVIEQVIQRVRKSRYSADLLVILPDDPAEDHLKEYCEGRGVAWHEGDRVDVTGHILQAAEERNATIVGICPLSAPLFDVRMFEASLLYAQDSGMDGVTVSRLPQGAATEAVPVKALKRLCSQERSRAERESLTGGLWNRRAEFECAYLPPPIRLSRSDIRLALETRRDYNRLLRLLELAENKEMVTIEEVIALHDQYPDLFQDASHALVAA